MPTDPVENISLQIPALPLDEDRNKAAALIAAIVSGGDIVGYLPLKATNNTDGTAILHVKLDTDPDIDIGSVNLLNIADAEINPATEEKQDDIITAIGGIAMPDPVGLKNIADVRIDPATEQKQDSIITQLLTQVRALFDSAGNAITSTLVGAKQAVDVFITNDSTTPIPVSTTRSDNAQNDAFGRLRVSNLRTLLDIQLQYNEAPLIWDTELSGGGSITHLPDESAVDLSVGTASGDKVIRQTHKFVRYSAGKSQQIYMSMVFNPSKTNLIQRVGYFSNTDGLFTQLSESGVAIVRRTSTSGAPVDVVTPQASWNIDRLDGTGPSGITLDITKSQLLEIDFEWLSVGRVRWGFVLGSSILYVHSFVGANNLTEAYMATANLPLRYEIENTGVTASASNLKQICSVVAAEGGPDRFESAIQRAANNGISGTSVSARRPVITLRPKLLFNGQVNRSHLLPVAFSLTAAKDIQFEIILDGALTGASFSSVDSNSPAELDTAATLITGGRVIDTGIISTGGGSGATSISTEEIAEKLALTLNSLGTIADTYTVTAEVSGPAGTVNASIKWAEVFQ